MTGDYTNGRPYILTHRDQLRPLHVRLNFLLPDGRRRAITIPRAADNEETHAALAKALNAGLLRDSR